MTVAALLTGGVACWPLHRGALLTHRALAVPLAEWWANTRLGAALGAVAAARRLGGEGG